MTYQKGKKKTGGRTVGSVNKTSKEVRNTLIQFLDDNNDLFLEKMSRLNDSEFCNLYFKMISIVTPTVKPMFFKALDPKSPSDWSMD